MRSPTDPEKCTVGELQRKYLPNKYTRPHGTVLRRPVESALPPAWSSSKAGVFLLVGQRDQWIKCRDDRPDGQKVPNRPP